ncbi:MAG: bifunctional precorrin-2 dehydrogenase/sirohydrochlorin ferrochelatase [Nitrospinota bacterium]|nr:bifunctional precorrin-2 dehydrogenase/sirohydrochlorin ferrochelatase [Nitrospinota bacterium]MDH5757299.1 bifunctional precorrin-2 dehydrogenase/sirohydrochlorin ferrochelatase [Nitrospinota bacterium]
MSALYPIFMSLNDTRCVVVGGGDVAARKIAGLFAVGARVTVVAPRLAPSTAEQVDKGAAQWIEGVFTPRQLDGATLVIASTDNNEVNQEVAREAKARNIPVNVVDQPQLCSFFVPSVVRRGGLHIAISTSGSSPAIAKRVRKKLENDFGPEWAPYLELMSQARQRALGLSYDQKTREEMFNTLADSALFDLVKTGDMDAAQRLVEEIVR